MGTDSSVITELMFRLKGFITFFICILDRILSKKFGGNADYFFWNSSTAAYEMGNYKVYWETLEEISRYQNECISGDPDKDPLIHTLELIEEHCEGNSLVGLSIGCSEDSPERSFCMSERFVSFDVFDIAGDLLSQQSKVAESEGLPYIKYIQNDLNYCKLEEERYDFIWALGTIHHIESLEHLFGQINKSLKKNGLFVMREYVGPNQIQWTHTQLEYVKQELATIPFKYKLKLNGVLKRQGQSVQLRHLMSYDPSESVRSEDIKEATEQYLSIVDWIDTGGTLLHPLLNDIAYNFEIDKKGRDIIKFLVGREKKLLRDGVLPSDYVFCTAKKRFATMS